MWELSITWTNSFLKTVKEEEVELPMWRRTRCWTLGGITTHIRAQDISAHIRARDTSKLLELLIGTFSFD
jgi:hypothetical protein